MKIDAMNVLVVEDDDAQREMLLEMLKRLNVRKVSSASNRRDAFGLIEKQVPPPDVIICDLDMPSVDGLEFVRRASQADCRSALVIASARDNALLASTARMATAYGGNVLGSIPKPISLASLQSLLMRHCTIESRLQGSMRAGFESDEIVDGLKRNQIEPFFQPIVELATKRVTGMEALARWRHPERGLITPDAFVHVLEQAGDIEVLTSIMLCKSVAFCSMLNRKGAESSVSINLALSSLHDIEFTNRVLEMLQKYDLDPPRLCFELTETAATTQPAAVLENLTRLRMKGISLAIDDFGIGYSSLQQLARLPFTELKIDQSFVTNANGNEAATAILKASLQIARDLKIKAVGEGIEAQEDWNMLRDLGCDLGQGYYIAKPMAAGAYLSWIDNLEANADAESCCGTGRMTWFAGLLKLGRVDSQLP